MLDRRRLLLALAAAGSPLRARGGPDFAAVTPRPLVFPRDHGAHPDYRTEWWYLTGWLDRSGRPPLGFQITFFRVRPGVAEDNPSAFAARQLLMAHAAIADSERGGLLHEERIARAGFGIVAAAEDDTRVRLDDWTFTRSADGSYRAEIPGQKFSLRLTAEPGAPILLQGRDNDGYSAKGPVAAQASHYYSFPQLRVRAELVRDGRQESAAGVAWLDHEWSSTLLAPDAAGWDWVGMNLADGGALTAFQIRNRVAGAAPVWTYACLRPPSGPARTYSGNDVGFRVLETWTSPRTRAAWPISQEIRIGTRTFRTEPLLPDQELDSRRTTGAVYWEGASRLFDSTTGQSAGRGYLEMTGYVERLRL